MARTARVKSIGEGTAYYHLVSRASNKQFLFRKSAAKDRLAERDSIDNHRIFITHAAASKEAVSAAENAVRESGRFEAIVETQAGSTISSHCGPNTLGVLFVRKK